MIMLLTSRDTGSRPLSRLSGTYRLGFFVRQGMLVGKPAFYSWRDAILASDVPSTTNHVLLALSCYMDDRGGSCFPSIATLARDTKLNERTVRKAIRDAQQRGWLHVGLHGFGGQTWRRHEYTVGWPEKVRAHDPHLDAEGADPGSGRCGSSVPKVRAQDPLITPEDQSSDHPNRKGPPSGPGYPRWFELLWQRFPARAGNNPKRAAYRAASARGEREIGEMAAGLERYRAFCEATGKIGTEHVMRASTFFGPDQPYRQTWDLPKERKNGVKCFTIDGEMVEVPTRPDPENDAEVLQIANRFGITLSGLERRDAIQKLVIKLGEMV